MKLDRDARVHHLPLSPPYPTSSTESGEELLLDVVEALTEVFMRPTTRLVEAVRRPQNASISKGA